jgi:hypothetical protein
VTSAQSAQVDMNLNGGTNLCPAGTIARGVVDFETAGSFVLCCTPATFPPNNLGCSSLNRYSCSGGVCVIDAFGSYSSQAQCEAALVRTITLSANFWNPICGCANCSPETYTFTLSPSAVAPFTPVYTYLDGICGGRYTVIVVDSLGNRVDQGVTCFDGVSCSMIGQGAVSISVSSSCP